MVAKRYDETYQRRQIRQGLEKLLERQNMLPPTAETQRMLDGLRAAKDAVIDAQRKYGEC